jgi:hypothetical protein
LFWLVFKQKQHLWLVLLVFWYWSCIELVREVLFDFFIAGSFWLFSGMNTDKNKNSALVFKCGWYEYEYDAIYWTIVDIDFCCMGMICWFFGFFWYSADMDMDYKYHWWYLAYVTLMWVEALYWLVWAPHCELMTCTSYLLSIMILLLGIWLLTSSCCSALIFDVELLPCVVPVLVLVCYE